MNDTTELNPAAAGDLLSSTAVTTVIEPPASIAHLVDRAEIREGMHEFFQPRDTDPPYITLTYRLGESVIAWTTDATGHLAELPADETPANLAPHRDTLNAFTRHAERTAFGEYLEGSSGLFDAWFPAGQWGGTL